MFIVAMIIGAILLEQFWYTPKRKKRWIEFEKTSSERWNEIVTSDPNAILPSDFDNADDPFVQDRIDDEFGPFLPGIEYSELDKEIDLYSMLQTRGKGAFKQ